MPIRTIVFDVNETLLDMGPLDTFFHNLFGKASVRGQWFNTLLQWSLVTTLTGPWRDFSQLSADSLTDIAAAHGMPLSDDDYSALGDHVQTLPAHSDVLPSLKRLRDAGFTVAALTNSVETTVRAQFEYNGLTEYFDHILSVDAVQRYKPDAAPYHMAARQLGVERGDMRLVAAHSWDVTGAMRAGCAAAFVARNNSALHPAGEQPDIVAETLAGVVDQIISRDG